MLMIVMVMMIVMIIILMHDDQATHRSISYIVRLIILIMMMSSVMWSAFVCVCMLCICVCMLWDANSGTNGAPLIGLQLMHLIRCWLHEYFDCPRHLQLYDYYLKYKYKWNTGGKLEMIISTMLLQHTTIINSKAYLEASLKLRLILYYENYSSFSITIVHGYVKNSKNTK